MTSDPFPQAANQQDLQFSASLDERTGSVANQACCDVGEQTGHPRGGIVAPAPVHNDSFGDSAARGMTSKAPDSRDGEKPRSRSLRHQRSTLGAATGVRSKSRSPKVAGRTQFAKSLRARKQRLPGQEYGYRNAGVDWPAAQLGTIDLPKLVDAGEDAPPVAIKTLDGRCGLLAVCDGMGGAGSRTATLHGIERSEAWHAARLGSSSIIQWLNSEGFSYENPDLDLLDLLINNTFQAAALQLPPRSSALKSRLIRTLPTTLVLGLWSISDGGLIDIQVAWLGDSRLYGLSPQDGLFQITLDDVHGPPDAFQSLRNDPPLTRCVTADETVRLHRGRIALTGPIVLFAASDGFFGYVQSPLHLEEELMKALRTGADWDDLLSILSAFAKRTAADDVSVAIALLGADFAEFQGSLRQTTEDRLREMRHLEALVAQARQLTELGRQATELAEISLKHTWDRNSQRYYKHAIGDAPEWQKG